MRAWFSRLCYQIQIRACLALEGKDSLPYLHLNVFVKKLSLLLAAAIINGSCRPFNASLSSW